MFHIGKKIEEVFNNSGMRISHFARAINTVPRNVYMIFEKPDIKTSQLQRIGKVLNHDFFKYYVQEEEEDSKPKTRGVHITFYLDGSEESFQEASILLKALNNMLKKKH
jgi:hypothetical protein